jgi:aminoglycoside 3-N-acetyltransferase
MPWSSGTSLSASEARGHAPDPAVAGALEQLNIPRDSVLMVHSAFKTMAREGHDLNLALGALVAHMAPGTLLLPTMSWRFVNPRNPVFDELATPCNTGALAEAFRARYATARSLHPTHSAAGLGRLAAEILSQHHLDDTPCSDRSPFGQLVAHDGWVLMLGIGMDCCTLIHHVEEIVAPDLYLRSAGERETYACRDRRGREFTVHLRRHLFLPRDYWQFQDALAARGELRLARVDNAVCRAFRARDLVRAVSEALRIRPDAIIARPGQRYRMM